jgi:hypothetical protein
VDAVEGADCHHGALRGARALPRVVCDLHSPTISAPALNAGPAAS